MDMGYTRKTTTVCFIDITGKKRKNDYPQYSPIAKSLILLKEKRVLWVCPKELLLLHQCCDKRSRGKKYHAILLDF